MKLIQFVSIIFLILLTGCQQKETKKIWTYKVIPVTEHRSWLPEELMEFKYDKIKIQNVAKIYEEKLNEYGKNGWQMVSMINGQIVLKK